MQAWDRRLAVDRSADGKPVDLPGAPPSKQRTREVDVSGMVFGGEETKLPRATAAEQQRRFRDERTSDPTGIGFACKCHALGCLCWLIGPLSPVPASQSCSRALCVIFCASSAHMHSCAPAPARASWRRDAW